jgi:hypothetical protein
MNAIICSIMLWSRVHVEAVVNMTFRYDQLLRKVGYGCN